MGGHRLGAGLIASHLDHDHGLQPRYGTQGAHEAARIADALDVHEDALGGRVIGQIVEQLAEIQIGRRAGGNDAGESDAVGGRPVQHGCADGAGLRYQGQIAGQRRAQGEGGVQSDGRALDAQAVGSDEADAQTLGGMHQFLFQCGALLANFTETGGQYHRVPDAACAAVFENAGYGRRGGGDDCQLGRLRQVGGVRKAGMPQHFLPFGIDGEDLALEARRNHVAEDDPGHGILPVACAEHGHGTRVEKGMKIVLGHRA